MGFRWAVDEWAGNEMVHFSRLLKIVGHRPVDSLPPTYFPIPLENHSTTNSPFFEVFSNKFLKMTLAD